MRKLNKEEILAMEPREIDYHIAEKVFDYKVTDSPNGSQIYIHEKRYNRPNDKHSGYSWGEIIKVVPKYSTDISAAWEVVEKLQPTLWVRMNSMMDDHYCGVGSPSMLWEHKSESMPECICKAALLAVMEL